MKRYRLAIDSDDNAYGYEDNTGEWVKWEDVAAELNRRDEVCLKCESEREQELGDLNDNAPWLTLAHTICTDAGIEPGHIKDRLAELREYMVDNIRLELECKRLKTAISGRTFFHDNAQLQADIEVLSEALLCGCNSMPEHIDNCTCQACDVARKYSLEKEMPK